MLHYVECFIRVSTGKAFEGGSDEPRRSTRRPGSSVGIVAGYGIGDRGSIPDRGRGFFL
jgi:hypothetical protein